MIAEIHDLATEAARHVAEIARRTGVPAPGVTCLLHIVLKGPHTSSTLAGIAGLTRSAMTYVVDGLERKRLVTRQSHPLDRRMKRVIATEQGTRIIVESLRALLPTMQPAGMSHAESAAAISAIRGAYAQRTRTEDT